jgi:hypothetical protein
MQSGYNGHCTRGISPSMMILHSQSINRKSGCLIQDLACRLDEERWLARTSFSAGQ